MHPNMEGASRKISEIAEKRVCFGIIGNGKMGTSIMDELFEKGYKVFMYCRRNTEKSRQHIEKALKRKLKRSLISEEEYLEKCKEFQVTSQLEDLKECNIIIESITENLTVKQVMFQKLDTIVSKDCILATNTSSIPLSKIFQSVTGKVRCLGMHFFYPVKLSNTVEINVLEKTGTKECGIAKEVVQQLGKMSVTFHEPNHMYLNNVISVISTQSYAMVKKYNIHPYCFNHEVLDSIMLYGAFDIVDSVEIPIIRESLSNFMDERHNHLYEPFFKVCSAMEEEGYLGKEGEKSFYDYFTDHFEMSEGEINEGDRKKYQDTVVAVCLNDLVYVLNEIEAGEVKAFLQAVKDVLGFSKDISDLYHELGYNSIQMLLEELEGQKANSYKVKTKEEFEHYF